MHDLLYADIRNKLVSIAQIGKIVKNKVLAGTCILSFLGRDMIKISGLGTDLR